MKKNNMKWSPNNMVIWGPFRISSYDFDSYVQKALELVGNYHVKE